MIETMQNTTLGPAVVQQTAGGLKVLLDGQEVDAINAMAFPYAPAKGDVLLVIGQEERIYAIGVLQSRGDTTLQFPANVHFSAPRGAITFSSGVNVEMQAPLVKVTAGAWVVVARTLTEKAHNAVRWVKDLATLRAGRRKVQVEGASIERAERHLIKAKKDVRVNGDRIHLG